MLWFLADRLSREAALEESENIGVFESASLRGLAFNSKGLAVKENRVKSDSSNSAPHQDKSLEIKKGLRHNSAFVEHNIWELKIFKAYFVVLCFSVLELVVWRLD